MNGQQGGDPAKLAVALVQLGGLAEPPLRFAAGADAVATFEKGRRTSWPKPTRTANSPRGLPHVDGEPPAP